MAYWTIPWMLEQMMTHHDHLPGPQPLIPRRPVPSLELDTVGGPTWRLGDQDPENFTLLVQSMPFARPEIEAVVNAIGFVLKQDYPARGEVLDEAPVGATA